MKRYIVASAVTLAAVVGPALPALAHSITTPGTTDQFGGAGLFVVVPDHHKGLSCAEKVSSVIEEPVLDPSVPCAVAPESP